MSVGRIALGVFLGNLAFALVAWAALTLILDNVQRRAVISATRQQYGTLPSQQNAAVADDQQARARAKQLLKSDAANR